MSKFKNTRKDTFFLSIPQTSLDDPKNNIVARCKFNFSYFDSSQEPGQDFSDWTHDQLCKFLNKLKDYSKENLEYWKTIKIGSGERRNSILVEYGAFPKNSDFEQPKHIPHQAIWSRFRLEQSVRLIGFTIPIEYNDKNHERLKFRFDSNTFYIVFLDNNHRFYKTNR